MVAGVLPPGVILGRCDVVSGFLTDPWIFLYFSRSLRGSDSLLIWKPFSLWIYPGAWPAGAGVDGCDAPPAGVFGGVRPPGVTLGRGVLVEGLTPPFLIMLSFTCFAIVIHPLICSDALIAFIECSKAPQ